MVASSVGYTGGTSTNPTYRSVCNGDGHTEAMKIDFDPSVISYEELMQRVLREASSYGGDPQYMSAVWALTEEQEAIAKRVAASLNKKKVPILPSAAWHDAEDYHQKYFDKSRMRF